MTDTQRAEATDSPVPALDGSRSLAESLGLSADDMDVIYNLAYSLYNQNRLDEAERVFGLLCMTDHLSERNWLGLGAARQLKKDFGGAVLAYSMAADSGAQNPTAPLHAAECYLLLGMHDQALGALKTALEWMDNGDDPDRILDRIDALTATLDQSGVFGQDQAVQ